MGYHVSTEEEIPHSWPPLHHPHPGNPIRADCRGDHDKGSFTALGRWLMPMNPDWRNPPAGDQAINAWSWTFTRGPSRTQSRGPQEPWQCAPPPSLPDPESAAGRTSLPSTVRTRLPSHRRRGPREVWAPGTLLRLRNKGGLCAAGGRHDGASRPRSGPGPRRCPWIPAAPSPGSAAAAAGRRAAALASPLVLPSTSGRKAPEEREEPHTSKG